VLPLRHLVGVSLIATVLTGAIPTARAAARGLDRALGVRGAVAARWARDACPPGQLSGIVGGRRKCLAAGELCSQQHRSDYARYGFGCAEGANGVYRLQPGEPSRERGPGNR